MKTETIYMTALALLPAALFTLTSCSSTSNSPPPVGSGVLTYKKGVPGGMIFQTVKVTATVTEIDQVKHKATLLCTDGKRFTVKVGRQAVNFDQVRVGDEVTATLTQKIVVTRDNQETPPGEVSAALVAQAPQGGQPGALVAETTQMTASIVSIDLDKRTATLQFEDGSTRSFARPDVDLSRLKLGDKYVFRVTESVAIWVEKTQ